jgi:hypothetical protein
VNIAAAIPRGDETHAYSQRNVGEMKRFSRLTCAAESHSSKVTPVGAAVRTAFPSH